MTDILCSWLNSEVRLSTKIEPTNFAREFASGFLLGELLHRFGLQNDFEQFSQNKTSDAKIKNFTRLEPNLHLLNVSFDTNVARDVMTEKPEAATRLLYELFISLSKKQKNNLTGVAMETMRPAAPVKLEGITSTMYRERLKHLTPRQTDLNLDMMMQRYHRKQLEMEKTAFSERLEQQMKRERQIQEQRLQQMQRLKENKEQTSEAMAKMLAASVNIPKPPPNKTEKAMAERRRKKKEIVIQEMWKELTLFDMKLKRDMTSDGSREEMSDSREVATRSPQRDSALTDGSENYMKKLKETSAEYAAARRERDKRRRKVLFEQMKAHEAQEEERRETMLVNQLMRQSLQERRIATQLLQTRHEKQVICNNRLMREKQFEERRLREFQLALDREAEMARLAKMEYEEQMQLNQELHNRILAERAQAKYKKHYDFCYNTVSDVVDLVTKATEYREMTNRLIPARLMRDWMDLFVAGQPQYVSEDENVEWEQDVEQPESSGELKELRHRILDDSDLNEYRLMVGEWTPPEASQISGPPRDNPVLGHVVHRLFNQVYPEAPPPDAPQFPPFLIKACILGKAFSGKTKCAMKLKDNYNIEVLSIDKLLNKAIKSFRNSEVTEEEYTVSPYVESNSSIHLPRTSESDLDQVFLGSATKDLSSGSEQNIGFDDMTSQQTPPVDDVEKLISDSNILAEKVESPEEKTDPEKPYVPETRIREVPTVRARLGEKALNCLTQGRAVDDEILVDIVIDRIRHLSEGAGWLLDGFPVNYSQLVLLEKALTGSDLEKSDSSDLKKVQLVPSPHPAPLPPKEKSGIDIVFQLELPDESCLKRSSGRMYAALTDSLYQQEFKPPPEGSITGVGNQEIVVPVHDIAHDQEQIHHRLTAYADEFPKMEDWFTNHSRLVKIDADEEEDAVVSCLKDSISHWLESGKEEEVLEEIALAEEKPPEEIPSPEPAKPVESVPELTSPEGRRSRGETRSGSGSRSKSGSRNKKDRSSSGGTSPKPSQKSPKLSKSMRKGGKGKKDLESEQESIEPTGPLPPQPGSDEWVYVNQPIEMGLAEVLVSYWEMTESSYLTSSRDIFQLIREEREQIIRYLYQIRMDFQEYLNRPDLKQEFVTQWQQNYNEIPDDLRGDDDMRADLHQRVDDLRERLWNISDERKEQAEKEQSRVMANGWVDDHTGILSNHYLSLMQAELDRFQDTVHLLQDYYRGMEGRVPDETSSDFTRIPLLEILPAECLVTSKGDTAERTLSGLVSPFVGDGETSKKASTPVGRKKKAELQEGVEEKRIIPVIPRRPTSPDNASRSKWEKGRVKGGKDVEDLPPAPQDLDEKLIYDVFVCAISSIEKILSVEAAQREAEEELERQKQAAKEAERKKKEAAERKKAAQAAKAGSDGKKSRSPSPKKGKGKDVPSEEMPSPSLVEEESEEEKQKKVDKEKGKQEYFTTIAEEAAAARCRINLIRCVSTLVLQDLRVKVNAANNEMNDWVGREFLKEMVSIDELSEVLRNAIETSSKLFEELNLQQKDFIINKEVLCVVGEDAKLGKTPSPLPQPEPVEESLPDTFTVQQIKALYNQFSVASPNGVLSRKSFQETIQTMAALAHQSELLPETWIALTQEKLELISLLLSADHECINWRSFLLQASQPWPLPTQTQLLESLQLFHEMDQKNEGTVTREQFNEIGLWLKESNQSATLDPTETPRFDRMSHLAATFFDIFADHSSDPSLLNYVDMLLYFGMAPDPFEGFLRALSVVTKQHMPRLPKKLLSRKLQPSEGTENLDKQLEDEVRIIWPDDIPLVAIDAKVTLDDLLMVILHGTSQHGELNRFILRSATDSKEIISPERLANVFMDLGADTAQQPLPLIVLLEHPVIQDLVYGCNSYKFVDLKALVMAPHENVNTEGSESAGP